MPTDKLRNGTDTGASVDQTREGEDGWVPPRQQENTILMDKLPNDKSNMKCNKCSREYLSTTKVPGNCPDCESSDVAKIAIDKSKKEWEDHDKQNRMNNCIICNDSGVMPFVGTPCTCRN